MNTTLSFGEGASCELALRDATMLAPNAARHPSVDDPAATMRAALAAPRDYPPLAAALAPGDRVTVALGRHLPRLESVLRGVLEELVAVGVAPSNITVLSSAALPTRADLGFDADLEAVRFAVHDPDDDEGLAMLGMTSAHRPLRLNRALTEADFVLPVTVARTGAGAGQPEKFAGLFPAYSSREAADRIQGRGKLATPISRAKRAAESDEAGWLLGVGMAVVVVPGPGGGVAAVVAGDPATAAREAAAAFQAIWALPTAERGDLVIGAVTGDGAEQTWGNLARAVAACGRVASPDGAIAVCCDLDEPPAGSFEALVDSMDFAAVARELHNSAAADARPAMVLAQALERGPVYLRSRLPAEVVESLGMTPIESDAELSRLVAGRRHCVVIEEAQRVRPRLVGDPNGME
jgi:hypothetical protein